MNLGKEHREFIESLLSSKDSHGSPEGMPNGTLDVSVVRLEEGQLVELRDGLVVDPEIMVEVLDKLTTFEGEFGSLEEVRDKLVQVKKIEESIGPLDELESFVESLEEKATKILESMEDFDYGPYHGLHDEEEEGEDEQEDSEEEDVLDVSDLTVREFLAMMLGYLAGEEEDDDEIDVDFEDLDLDNIADMKVSDVLKALREGGNIKKVESAKPCSCGDKKKINEESAMAEPMYMSGMEVMGTENKEGEKKEKEKDQQIKQKHHYNHEKHEETYKKEEGEMDQEDADLSYAHHYDHNEEEYEKKDKKTEESFEFELFKRLLDRLG